MYYRFVNIIMKIDNNYLTITCVENKNVVFSYNEYNILYGDGIGKVIFI